MAEQTTSSIVIDAPPAAVMAVIADFPAYPEWAQGMKKAEWSGEGARRPRRAGLLRARRRPIKDAYTLAYDWHGDARSPGTSSRARCSRRWTAPTCCATAATAPPRSPTGSPSTSRIPMIGMLKRKAEKVIIDTALKGLKKRVESLGWLTPPVRIILFTGKGGVGKTTVAAGTATLAAARRPAHAGALHRRRPLPRGRLRRAARRRADGGGRTLFVQQVDAQRRFERSWAEIQGYLLSVLDAAGVDPITAEELTVIPGAEEVLALLELRLHALVGRLGRDRRRLRAHGRDAAAAGAPRGARAGTWTGSSRSSGGSSRRCGRC